MKKLTQVYIVDVLLAISFFLAGITGVVKMPGWFNTGSGILRPLRIIHDWSGIIMVGLVLVHLIQHWKWIVAMTRKLLFGNEKSKRISTIIIAVILTLIVSLAATNIIEKKSTKTVEYQNDNTTNNAELHSETAQYDNVKTGDCPHGVENDQYPGLCGLYEDKNNNGECDHGE